ncbi:MAG: hypothetical protein LDL26_13290 [Caenispirillum bisanense]|nr:hypothetical protein [Caenispirillum bisanense]MCA1975329.1 hypothetical protein [Caenispirillum sp.]
MADRSEDTRLRGTEPPAMHESKPHPDQGRPSTTTGESTRATDSRTGLGADDRPPQKSNALRMVMLAVLAVVVVAIIVGLFA